MPLSQIIPSNGILSWLNPFAMTHHQLEYQSTFQYISSLYHHLSMTTQIRHMTRHRRVRDRSKKKRIHDLEVATERYKVVSKVLAIMEILKKEPEEVIPMWQLERYKNQINLRKPYKVADFVRKSPKLFEMYRDSRGGFWCGLTTKAEELVEEEARLLEINNERTVEYVSRLLMMASEKKLPVDKIAHFRRDLGLPGNFRMEWVHRFPEHFRLARAGHTEFLELVSWNPNWAITELEKKLAPRKGDSVISGPGELSLPFPMKFPPDCKRVFKHTNQFERFQKTAYLSPYADARRLAPGTQGFEKRAVAIVHEILSFTLEKRVVTDHLTHFRKEFLMPQKLMRILLKYFGVFYVSERGKRYSVFLNEAYNGSELVTKAPLVIWREKVLRLTGYRGKMKRKSDTDDDPDDDHGRDDRDDDDDDDVFLDDGDEDMMDPLTDDDSEMDEIELCDSHTD